MRVLFVAVFTPGSTNIGQADAFETLGHEVHRYDFRAKRAECFGTELRDLDLIELIRRSRPNLTVFSKCNEMSARVVAVANEWDGTSCLWFMDPMNANFNAELIQKINEASFSCFGQVPLEEVKKVCPFKRVFFACEGYDSAVDFPYEGVNPMFDMSFIGSIRDPRRKALHDAVGFPVHSGMFGRDHAKAVAETRVNLNLTYEEGGTSDRVHKIMAAGGFVLTQPWHGMDALFAAGKHLAIFETAQDLRDEVKYYVEHEDERLEIARCGQVQNQQYSRTGWAEFLISKMKKP